MKEEFQANEFKKYKLLVKARKSNYQNSSKIAFFASRVSLASPTEENQTILARLRMYKAGAFGRKVTNTKTNAKSPEK